MRIVAVDQGSSSTKGALFVDGAVAARAAAPVRVRRAGDRAEHGPLELLASVRQVLRELAPEPPDAVALVCQRSTCLLWERAGGRPLTTALSWQDSSAAARVAPLVADAAVAGEVARRSGLRLSPYYAAPKLALLLAATPGARERAMAGELLAGTLDAFLAHHLAGAPSTEPGHAGRSLLYDLDGDRWDPWLCDTFGVPPEALPPLLPSVAARGAVADCGGAPLVAVAGDQQAALVGHGGPGVAVCHFGTGAFVLVGSGQTIVRRRGLLSAVTWSRAGSRTFQLEGAVNAAGSAADWAAALTGVPLAALPDGELDPESLPWCVPGFVGVGSPAWLPTGGASLTGVRLEHTGVDLVRGVLAGVALRVVDCLEELAAAGVPPRLLRASGRLPRLPGLAQLLADASGLAVELPADEEAGLVGAARLAAVALDGPAGAPPDAGAAATFTPRWPAARRDRVRARWREALAAAAAAAPGARKA